MSRTHIVFNLVTLLVAAELLAVGCVFYFLLLPTTPLAQQHIFRAESAIAVGLAAVLVLGATANLVSRRLVIWSTFLIMAGYFATILFLPLAVWGWFALREELDRTAQ
jgi:hypothetical protein